MSHVRPRIRLAALALAVTSLVGLASGCSNEDTVDSIPPPRPTSGVVDQPGGTGDVPGPDDLDLSGEKVTEPGTPAPTSTDSTAPSTTTTSPTTTTTGTTTTGTTASQPSGR